MKPRCKGTTRKGMPCIFSAALSGFCIVHYNIDKKKQKKKQKEQS